MQPKIEAALDYLEAGGRETIITSIDTMDQALAGENGTVIYREESLPSVEQDKRTI